jgi:uncharacterized protein
MTQKILAALFCCAAFGLVSCNKTKSVVLSTFPNGKPRETIELNKPVGPDSLGLMKVYFENGDLHVVGKSRKGKREGEWICYYPDGKIEWTAFFKDGTENGETTYYDKEGFWKKSRLKNGIREGKYTSYFYDWFDSVKCYINGNYVHGIEEGLWTKTDTSGVLLVEMTYVKGKAIGYFTNRYKNGRIKLVGEIDENGSMKNFKFFDENGNLQKKDSYILRKI